MNRAQTVTLRAMPWYGDTEIEISFPEAWEINICPMKGQDTPRLSEAGIRKAFSNPIGTKSIRELARGKKEVVIIFDDMSRPTPVAEIIPFVLGCKSNFHFQYYMAGQY